MIFLFFGICSLIPPLVFTFIHPLASTVRPFILSFLICGFCGLLLIFSFYSKFPIQLHSRDIFLLTCLAWIVAPIASSLPFYFYPYRLFSFCDALFESVSALSTTGWSVFDVEGIIMDEIILWRSMLNWVGGLGVIIVMLALFPMPRDGGFQLMRTEFSDRSEKFFPKISQMAFSCLALYLALSLLCLLSAFCFVPIQDALCFAMSTVSTAGFPIQFLNNFESMEYLSIIFLALGSIPFSLLVKAIMSKKLSSITQNIEVKAFLGIWIFSSLTLMLLYFFHKNMAFSFAFKNAFLNSINATSTSGFDSLKETGESAFLLCLGMLGGCTGSTTGGFKIARLISLSAVIFSYFRQQVHPKGIFLPHLGKSYIKNEEITSMLVFITLFVFVYLILNFFLMSYGFSKWDSIVCSISAISNVGIGSIMESKILAHSYILKLLLMFAMIVGRLELLPIFIIFHRSFWKP